MSSPRTGRTSIRRSGRRNTSRSTRWLRRTPRSSACWPTRRSRRRCAATSRATAPGCTRSARCRPQLSFPRPHRLPEGQHGLQGAAGAADRRRLRHGPRLVVQPKNLDPAPGGARKPILMSALPAACKQVLLAQLEFVCAVVSDQLENPRELKQRQRDDQAADRGHQRARRYLLDRPAAERRGEQRRRSPAAADAAAGRAKLDKERGGRRDGDEELGGVDRSDGLARRMARADQRRRHHRTPAAAAAGVEKPAGKADRRQPLRRIALRGGAMRNDFSRM